MCISPLYNEKQKFFTEKVSEFQHKQSEKAPVEISKENIIEIAEATLASNFEISFISNINPKLQRIEEITKPLMTEPQNGTTTSFTDNTSPEWNPETPNILTSAPPTQTSPTMATSQYHPNLVNTQ